MTDTYKASTRVYRERRDDDSDDERFKSTTVTRYKVKPLRGDRYERTERTLEVDDDRRTRYNSRHRHHGDHAAEFVEYERRERSYGPDRPRSSLDDRPRTILYEQDIERERREDWDRRPRHGHYEDDVKVEKRVEERFDDAHGHEVERYRKETEYYHQNDPPSSPVVVRQRAPDQTIIVKEAPPQAPMLTPRHDPSVIVLRERESDRDLARGNPYDEEYYYRHERRELGPYRGERDRDRDRDWGVIKRDRRRRDEEFWSDDEDYYHHRRATTRRERSESPNHHHKLHLAEGALAGAGISALLASRRDKNGEIGDHRSRKVFAGAALGALGTEVLKRAHSSYEDNWGDGRESPDHHSTLKKTLGVAAVALAAAGAAKLYEANKIEREEIRRGRSRNRGFDSSGDEYSRSRSRSKSRRRSLSTFAKAALGTAATAGVVKHFRNKSKSRSRSRYSRRGSRSRSKSKLRRGAELAGAAAAAGVAGKMWKDHHDKKKKDGSTSRGLSEDESDYRPKGDTRNRSGSRSRSRSRSGSRSRSRARSLHSDSGADPGLGLVEYGRDPIDHGPLSASGRGYESEAEERRRNRRRRRDRSASSSGSDGDAGRRRSGSGLKDVAAAGAASMVVKEVKNRRDKGKQEKRERSDLDMERERERRERESREREKEKKGKREREKREREKEREKERERIQIGRRPNDAVPDNNGYFHDHHPQSPPTFSGGSYFPSYSAAPTYPRYPENPSVPPQREYTPYVPPQDYSAYAPPPPPPVGPPPPAMMSGANGGYEHDQPGLPATGPAPPPGPPPGPTVNLYPRPADDVSDQSSSHQPRPEVGDPEADGITPASTPSPNDPPTTPSQLTKTVSFGPLSPKSSRTMQRHRRDQIQVDLKVSGSGEDAEPSSRPQVPRRRSSDATHDRPRNTAVGLRRQGSDSEGEVEMLPERFDSQGRPLDQGDVGGSRSGRWTSRSGTFRREPGRHGGWDASGAWSVGGTDAEHVERLVRHVTGALEGRGSWMGVIGEVLGSGLLPAVVDSREGKEEGDGAEDGRRKRKRG